MKEQVGRVVYSKAGRDKGRFMVITAAEGETLWVCDGKERPLERPKKKNRKHIGLTNTVLDSGSMSTNRSLRRALKPFGATNEPVM